MYFIPLHCCHFYSYAYYKTKQKETFWDVDMGKYSMLFFAWWPWCCKYICRCCTYPENHACWETIKHQIFCQALVQNKIAVMLTWGFLMYFFKLFYCGLNYCLKTDVKNYWKLRLFF